MTAAAPTVSVIVALFNAADELASFVRRAEEIARRDGVQLIVVDDASADGTWEGIASMPPRPNVELVRQRSNRGVALTRNAALERATGEYVWFVDHDDDWSAESLDLLRARADGHDMVVGRADFRYGDGERDVRGIDGLMSERSVSGEEAARLLLEGSLHGFLWTKLIRRSLLGEAPFPAQRSQSDVVGVARALSGAQTVRFVPDLVYTYRRRPGSITRTRTPSIASLTRAHREVVDHLGGRAGRGDVDLFTAWFLCLAVVTTSVRWRAPRVHVQESLRVARSASRAVSVRAVAGRSPRLAAYLVVVRLVPGMLPPVLRLAYLGLDGARELRGNGTVAASRLVGFVALPALSLLIPLLLLPRITSVFGEGGWVAIAVAQSVGTAFGVAVELGWSTAGPQRVARQSDENRRAHLAFAVATRFVVGLPLAAIAGAVTMQIAHDHRLEAGVLAVVVAIGANNVQWHFVGAGTPGILLVTDVLPRLVLAAVAFVVLPLAGNLWVYLAFTAAGNVVAFVFGIIAARVSPRHLRGVTIRRMMRAVGVQLPAVSGRIVSATYIALPVALVSVAAPSAVAVFAGAERLQRTALSALQMLPNAMQAWVGGARGESRLARARLALAANAAFGMLAGAAFALIAPPVSAWLFSGVATVPPALASIAGLVIAITCTSRASGGLVLVALGRIRSLAVSAVAGLVIGAPLILILGRALGAPGGLIGEVCAEAAVLIVQLRAIGQGTRAGRLLTPAGSRP